MYELPAFSTAVNVPDDMRFSKDSFTLSEADREIIDYIMLPEGLIKSRTEALAQEIVASWRQQGLTEVHVLVIMNGAFHFYSHLMEGLNRLVIQTEPRIYMIPQFVKLSSYVNTQSTGEVKIGHVNEIAGKHVLVVEDMYSTGRSMMQLLKALNAMGASKV